MLRFPSVGRIAPGMPADIVVLTDDLEIERVLVGGTDRVALWGETAEPLPPGRRAPAFSPRSGSSRTRCSGSAGAFADFGGVAEEIRARGATTIRMVGHG